MSSATLSSKISGPVRSVDGLWFGKDLSESEPIPEEAIEQAVALMRSGRLHRYGEQLTGYPEPSLLEQDYAAYVGARYCVAVSSCGAAMFLALKALGVKPGDPVLTSSFTLAPVPGAIAHAAARLVLVETTSDYTTDLDDLEHKAATSGARVFLLSHMRGHITDLAAVRAICDRHDIALVEDCAHTYLGEQAPMPQSVQVLGQLLDLRTPLTLTPDDCRLIGTIIRVAAAAASDAPVITPHPTP